MKIAMHSVLMLAASTLLLLSACDDSSGTGSSSGTGGTIPNASSYEGLWRLVEQSIAEGDCGADPVAVDYPYSDTLAVVQVENFSGRNYLSINSCAQLSECDSVTQGLVDFNQWSYRFNEGSDVSGYTDVFVTAKSNLEGDDCEGYSQAYTIVADGDQRLVVRIRKSASAYYDADEEGLCWTDAAAKVVDTSTCVSEETLVLVSAE